MPIRCLSPLLRHRPPHRALRLMAGLVLALPALACAQVSNPPDAAASAPAAAASAAQDEATPANDAAPALDAQAAARPDPDVLPPPVRFEGAIGPVVDFGRGSGDSGASTSITPGFFLRYKGWSVSNTGAFVTRRRSDIFPGLGADLRYSDTIRTNLGLRLDRGRGRSVPGMDSVGATVRARLSTTWTPPRGDPLHGWRYTLSATTDLLGRGGGQTFDAATTRDWHFGPYLVWTLGGDLAAGSGAYMRQQYGVRPDEAARTGLPAYAPGAGLRDVSLGTSWRLEFQSRWVAFWGGSIGRLLGPAAASPLTVTASHWGLQGGVARRF